MCEVYLFDILKLVINKIFINAVFCFKNENQVLENIDFADI